MHTSWRPAAMVLCAVALSGLCTASAGPTGGDGPKDQFQSVVYVRGIRNYAQYRDMYLQLRPHSFMSSQLSADPKEAEGQLAEIRGWGCRYLYDWFNTTWFYPSDTKPPKPGDPYGDVGQFTQGVWDHWDECRAAGVVSGERPAKYEDLFCVSRAYAEALASNADKKPERIVRRQNRVHLCINNPDVRRIMTDLLKYRASHGFGKRFNGVMTDLVGVACEDWSEFSRSKFEQWVRKSYSPEQIRTILQTDPDRPIPMLPPRPDKDLARVYNALVRQFWTLSAAEYFRELKEAGESVLGKGNFHTLVNANCFGWQDQDKNGVNMAWWGDAVDTYCAEAGIWPGMGGRSTYTGLVLPDMRTNLFDFQYGAGRLSGEPVMVKAYFYDPANPQIAQLGMAEGMALLGNMGLYVTDRAPNKVVVPGTWVLPMVQFAQKVTPQVRQMIPAGEVGVLFSAADFFCDFGENYRQVYEVCDILQRQHVPFQMVHMVLLERVLKERPLRTLIVPWVRCMKDAQVAALKDFAARGGRIVLVGECGTYTWEGVRRPQSAFADWQPGAPGTAGEAGAGRVAWVGGQLGGSTLQSGQALQRAVFAVSGATPSVVRPDLHPGLLLNLTRNSDNSSFWMHLLNYDVDMDAPENAPGVVRPAENVRLVIPLPAGLLPAAVKLYRPGTPDQELKADLGAEGCAVTVPRVDIYALVQVVTQPGKRPATRLSAPTDIDEAVQAVVGNLSARPAARKLVPPPCPLPKEPAKGKPQWLIIGALAYVTAGPDRTIPMEVRAGEGSFPLSYTVYQLDGAAVASGVVGGETVETVKVPEAGTYALAMQAGMKRHGVVGSGNDVWSVRFPQETGACFEASPALPLNLRKAEKEEDDAALYYFYVPKACRSFKVVCDTSYGRAVRLIVKGPSGDALLDESGDMKRAKPFEIKVPDGAAGRIWSLALDNPATGKRKYSTLYLEGVPALLADSPARLLIGEGDE